MFQRICFEITIQRTFLDCERFHSGHPNGRHYLNLKTPYLFNYDKGSFDREAVVTDKI
jgi:hypothetical protein